MIPPDSPRASRIAPDGQSIAAGGGQEVRLWEVASHREAGVLRGHVASIQTVVFSPDGTRLASGGHNAHILLWDIATRRRVARLTGHAIDSTRWTSTRRPGARLHQLRPHDPISRERSGRR